MRDNYLQHGDAGHRRAREVLFLIATSISTSTPLYKDRFGRPLLRVTIDFHENELKQNAYLTDKFAEIIKAMGAKEVEKQYRKAPYDVTKYQTTHLCGGAIMGTDPSTSALNRYLQSWDVPNLFVMGASAFPQNAGYNPTGTVAALAYWSAQAIRTQYLKNPGPLISMRKLIARRIAGAAIVSLILVASLEGNGSRAGTQSGRTWTRRISARSTGGVISPSSATARAVTLCPAQISPTPAAGRSRRRSASWWGLISRPIPRPASVPGLMSLFVPRFARRQRACHGQLLYPAMPYPYYTKVTESDALGIRAYLNTVKPVHNAVVSNKLPFPFDVREGMAAWKHSISETANSSRIQRSPPNGIEALTLSKVLAHCGACHTPKSTLGGDDRGRAFQGYALQGWFAPNITNDNERGLGGWSVADIVAYLKNGHNPSEDAAAAPADRANNCCKS